MFRRGVQHRTNLQPLGLTALCINEYIASNLVASNVEQGQYGDLQ
jgi:hypothetical protein